jgi:nucleoside-diphosphate-sugar epimerase
VSGIGDVGRATETSARPATPARVWVTGSRGFVGSALASALAERGADVVRVSNSASSPGVEQVDYASADSIAALLGARGTPDVVFHLGWGQMHDAESPVHLEQNVREATTLVEELFRRGVPKVVLVGSVDEYGGREGELVESDPAIGRLTRYAQGKSAVSAFGRESARRHGAVYLHVRLTHVLGVPERRSSLIHQLYAASRAGTPIQLTACDQFRDYVHVADAAEGLLRIEGIGSSEVVNLGSGSMVRLRQVVELLWSMLDGRPEDLLFGARQRPGNEPDQQPCRLSVAKLEGLTGWRPGVSIEEGVARTVAELRRRAPEGAARA